MARRGFRGKRVEAKRAGMMAIASKELPVYTTEDNPLIPLCMDRRLACPYKIEWAEE